MNVSRKKQWNYDQNTCLSSELQKDAHREMPAVGYSSKDFNGLSVCAVKD